MSNAGFVPSDPPTPTQAERIDRICDDFERAWQSGEKPRLEDYLQRAMEADAARVLHGLIALELAYRRLNGEHPAVEEYRTRFPQHVQTVEAVFAEPETPTQETQPWTGAESSSSTPPCTGARS